MTDTLISLLSILIGIISANLIGFCYKKKHYEITSYTIASVFTSILFIKIFGRLGIDAHSIIESGSIDWILFLLNLFISTCGGAFAVLVLSKLKK